MQSWDLSAHSRPEATPHMCCSVVVTHSVEVHVSCVNHSNACMYSAASAATAIATHSLMVWCHVCLLVAQCLCCSSGATRLYIASVKVQCKDYCGVFN